MKKINYILALVFLVLCTCLVTACTKNKETSGTGYGIVHKDYVGIAEIKVKGDKVTALTFEEVYLPSTWAALTTTEGIDENLYLTITNSHGGEVNLAKYLIIGDKHFTGSIDNDTVVYSSSGIPDLKAWIATSEDNAKWYATTLLEGNVKVANSEFVAQSWAFSGSTKEALKKSTSNYWPAGGTGLGWKKNMEALEKTLIGSKMNFDESKIVKEGTWKFDQVTSEATLTDAKDYYAVAKRAYNNATK